MLAHSLRDAGTTKKLAILVTLDSISSEVITQLKASSHATVISGRMMGYDLLTRFQPKRPCTTM